MISDPASDMQVELTIFLPGTVLNIIVCYALVSGYLFSRHVKDA